jgi:hypothetical protein
MAAQQPLPRVVHLKIAGGKIVQDCDAYIGRQCFRGGWQLRKSPWANPFSANKYTREGAIDEYRRYILAQFAKDSALWTDRLKELAGAKTLGCWCKPLPCHGDVLVDFLDRYFERYAELAPAHVAALAREMLGEA